MEASARKTVLLLFGSHDCGANELVEFGKFSIEIGVATFEHFTLVAGSHASA
jgi:hypothetical protein